MGQGRLKIDRLSTDHNRDPARSRPPHLVAGGRPRESYSLNDLPRTWPTSRHTTIAAGLSALVLAAVAWAVDGPANLEPPVGAVLAPPPDSGQMFDLRRRGLPFGPGERLEFSVDYGPIKAGTSTLEVLAMRSYRGRVCYHFV